jgi:hypothetical protein
MRVLKYLAVLAIALGPSWAAAGSLFLVEFEDLPLAPGLAELPGGTLFESADGRIVEATAAGETGAMQVLAFYAETLPHLGWTKVGEAAYRRDNELLSIRIEVGRPLTVHFSVVPR